MTPTPRPPELTATDIPVLFDTVPTASGHRFGIATLNAPGALNALSLDMVRLLAPRLADWAADPSIAGVWLDGAGDKAFCAGGDLRQLYPTLRTHRHAANPAAEAFFSEEYALDHLIHHYPKPFVAWAHGIVMGGGVGLMAGASHRVVTERTRLAMPEVGIGLFPDVGGSWFLQRMPGRIGLFLALTAAPLDAADTLHVGLGDVYIPHARKAAVRAAIGRTIWHGEAGEDRRHLRTLLADHGDVPAGPSRVAALAGTLDALVAGDDLAAIGARLRTIASDDPWLQAAGAAFAHGSPTSAALTFALWQRTRGMTLGDVLRLEYQAALGCCAHHDFAEGIRAVLVDKDRQPRWQPATPDEVTPAFVDDHLRPRGDLPARLARL